jgi:hypothetical protein
MRLVVNASNEIVAVREIDASRVPQQLRWPSVLYQDFTRLLPPVIGAQVRCALDCARQTRQPQIVRCDAAFIPGECRLLHIAPTASDDGGLAVAVFLVPPERTDGGVPVCTDVPDEPQNGASP